MAKRVRFSTTTPVKVKATTPPGFSWSKFADKPRKKRGGKGGGS